MLEKKSISGTDNKLFEKPTSKDCRLMHNDECSGDAGCPLHPGSSCSHGLEGQICEYGMFHKKHFEQPATDRCQLIIHNICSSKKGCPLHPGSNCSHGLEGQVCEYGITN